MQFFYDPANGNKQYAFGDDVKVAGTPGAYTFTATPGAVLGPFPDTLVEGVAPASASATLAAAQAEQRSFLGWACAKAIISGFTSSALGAPHSYGSTMTDQANLQGAAVASTSAGPGWQTPIWCADEGGAWALVQHTGPQAMQVHSDMVAMISAARVRLAAMKAAVATETTVAAVQAIGW